MKRSRLDGLRDLGLVLGVLAKGSSTELAYFLALDEHFQTRGCVFRTKKNWSLLKSHMKISLFTCLA